MSQIQFEEKTYNTESLDIGLWKRMLKLLGRRKKNFIKLGIFMTLLALLDVLRPLLNRQAINYFARGQFETREIVIYGIIYFLYILGEGIMVTQFANQSGYIESGFMYDVRKQMYDKIQQLSYSYFDRTPTGWIMARLTSDVGRLSEIMAWSLTDMVWGFGMMIAASVIMLVTDWKMALIVLASVPVLAYVSLWFQLRILKNYRDVRRTNSKITNSFSESIAGQKTTKTLGLEDTNYRDFKSLAAEYHRQSYRAACFSSTFMPIVIGISNVVTAFLIYYGGNQVFLQAMEFGTMMMFVEYASQFFEPLRQIAGILAELQMAQASAERVMTLLDEQVEIQDSPEVIEKYGTILEGKTENYPAIKGDIEFKNVSFYYNEKEPVLTDFSLKVKAGTSVALVGETGSGKSTIVNLLCRFYQPVEGQILIDGVDYRERSLGWLHSNIGYVLQSPTLFSGTVKDNIRYGNLNATDQQVEAAARLVSADKFIEKMDKGYDSEVGEGGSRLSTGEKQLISFARAVIADPALMILDEATSSVDTETEKQIQDAISSMLKGRTSFVVAHRLSTIINSDIILVIDKGRIAEQGTHKDLMEKKGKYYSLYIQQFNQQLQQQLLGVREEFSEEREYEEEED